MGHRFHIKGLGGISITHTGASVWHVATGGHHLTFRLGVKSGIADIHRTKTDGSHDPDPIWVAKTGELIAWIERTLCDETCLRLLQSVYEPSPWAR